MKAYERFLKYVSVWTTSDETSETVPSADRELVLAELLVEEMKELGIEDARVDEKGYVYGSVPATLGCENAPALGLIAHMDTAPDASGDNIHPQIIENYDGKDVVLGTSGKTIKVEEFPYLADLKGRTLITTDGTTLLGADDKAGIAEVLTVVDEILKEGLPHGKICIGFTPDEEIARGAKHFDVEGFGADYGYTLDGSAEGEIQYENFNASTAFITIHGVSCTYRNCKRCIGEFTDDWNRIPPDAAGIRKAGDNGRVRRILSSGKLSWKCYRDKDEVLYP